MDISFFFLIVTGSLWLAKATSTNEFRESRVTRLGPYITGSRLSRNLKAGPPCYCSWLVCYYCPGDTYCTVDGSGCCPEPGCSNGCGSWCLCPGYPVCCPDGACPEDYPTCCGEVCCKDDGNCCETEHCCDAESSCCEQGCCPKDNGKCCTSSTTEETVCCVKEDVHMKGGDRKEDVKNTHLTAMNTEEERIFIDLCRKFKPFYKSPPKTKTIQYAVLVVGRLSDTYRLDPMPTDPAQYNDEGLCIGKNYAAARFIEGGGHTEDKILAYADNMINEYIVKYHQNPELFLFSKNSPCCGSPLTPRCINGCAGIINTKLRELRGRITSMVIAWDQNYKLAAMPFDKAFLYSLEATLSPGNAQLSWNTNGYCRKSSRKWLQQKMFECLLETAKSHFFCSATVVEGDLARLINKVTWICGTTSSIEEEHYTEQLDFDDGQTFDQISVGIPPSRNPTCWRENVASLDTFDCSPLPGKAFDCAEKLAFYDLGPALDPSNPIKFSNAAVDVRGDYSDLCFQSGSCSPPGDSQVQRYKMKADQTADKGESRDEL